jgi:4'-phosphopantetheinyl transferase
VAVIGVRGNAANLGSRGPGAGAGIEVVDVSRPAQNGDDRTVARARIRAALREALAAVAGVPAEKIMIQSEPGRAPAVSYSATSRGQPPGIAISHDGPLSLAAINLHGAIGIDLMRVQAIPDWREVACDFLGPEVAARLAASEPALRAEAFARAWTAHEAGLKCLGLQLTEWSPRLQERLSGLRCRPLELPSGFVGTVACL